MGGFGVIINYVEFVNHLAGDLLLGLLPIIIIILLRGKTSLLSFKYFDMKIYLNTFFLFLFFFSSF